jgi:hypothetical protein
MLRFFVTIIEKFCDAQPERKGGIRHRCLTERAIAAATTPISNREAKIPQVSVSRSSNELRGIRLALSNRELNLLERKLSHCKQTKAAGSNRELSTICNPAIVSLSNTTFSSKNLTSKSPLTDRLECLGRTKGSGELPIFLPGSSQNVECDVSSRKQSPKKFLPGATTTPSRYTKLRNSHTGKPPRIHETRAKIAEHSLLLSPRNFIGLQDRDCRSVRLTISAQK